MNTLKSLVEYGLSENEAQIYLFLLKKIEATVFVISRETLIPRTTTYATLNLLKEKGFISSFKKNNVLYFSPESTRRLDDALEEKKALLKSIMPELNEMIGTGKFQPSVKIFVGEKAVRGMLDDVLEVLEKQKIKTLYALSHPIIFEYFPKYFKTWLSKRELLGVSTQLLMSESARNKNTLLEKNILRQVRYTSEDFVFDSTVNIYNNKVSFVALREGELYGILIESETIADLLKKFFLFTWNNSNE